MDFSKRTDGQIAIAPDGRLYSLDLNNNVWRSVRAPREVSLSEEDRGAVVEAAANLPQVRELNSVSTIELFVDEIRGTATPRSPVDGDAFSTLQAALVWASGNGRLANLNLVVKLGPGYNRVQGQVNTPVINLSQFKSVRITSERSIPPYSYANLKNYLLGSSVPNAYEDIVREIKSRALIASTNLLSPQYVTNLTFVGTGSLILSSCKKLEIDSLSIEEEGSTGGAGALLHLEDIERVHVRNVFGKELTRALFSEERVIKTRIQSSWFINCFALEAGSEAFSVENSVFTSRNLTTSKGIETLGAVRRIALKNVAIFTGAGAGAHIKNCAFTADACEVYGCEKGLLLENCYGLVTNQRLSHNRTGASVRSSFVEFRACNVSGNRLGLMSQLSYVRYVGGSITNCGPNSTGSGAYVQGGHFTLEGSALSGNSVAAFEMRAGASLTVVKATGSQRLLNTVNGLTSNSVSTRGIYSNNSV